MSFWLSWPSSGGGVIRSWCSTLGVSQLVRFGTRPAKVEDQMVDLSVHRGAFFQQGRHRGDH